MPAQSDTHACAELRLIEAHAATLVISKNFDFWLGAMTMKYGALCIVKAHDDVKGSMAAGMRWRAYILVTSNEPGGPPLQLLCRPAGGVDDIAVGLAHLPHLVEVQPVPVAPVEFGEDLLKFLGHKSAFCVVYLAV